MQANPQPLYPPIRPEVGETDDTSLVELLLYYRKHPLAFIKHVIGAQPTKQQERLIKAATRQDARTAVKSATATGKTACLTWLALYFVICFPDARILVTAPTSGQLHRVFRSELVKWQQRMNPVFADFYEIMATNIHIKGAKETQFIDLVTGTAENKESFAGLHGGSELDQGSKGLTVIIVDEASALPDEIFDTLYGTLSSGSTAFILVSNPVRNSGKFYDLFQIDDASQAETSWELMTFTSYDSPNVNKKWIDETINYYGEESDFVRMRINGEFPIASSAQFLSSELISTAIENHIEEQAYYHYERILSVDVARYGDDSSVVIDRQGPKLHSIETYHSVDTATLSHYIMQKYKAGKYAAIFVDGIGVGAGVVDNLKKFSLPVVDVIVSSRSTNPSEFFDLRAQVYGEMKEWLKTADIIADREMKKQMLAIQYSYNKKLQMFMESKKDMKKREGFSPDIVDAIAYSFADNVYKTFNKSGGARPIIASGYNYA